MSDISLNRDNSLRVFDLQTWRNFTVETARYNGSVNSKHAHRPWHLSFFLEKLQMPHGGAGPSYKNLWWDLKQGRDAPPRTTPELHFPVNKLQIPYLWEIWNRWIVTLIVQYTKFVLCFQIYHRVFLGPSALACKQAHLCEFGENFQQRTHQWAERKWACTRAIEFWIPHVHWQTQRSNCLKVVSVYRQHNYDKNHGHTALTFTHHNDKKLQ